MLKAKQLFASLILSALPLLPTHAADSKAVTPERVIVGYAPGGATDVIARVLSRELSKNYSKPIVVENRPGAGGMIGAELLSRAKPDGSSLLMAYISEASINKLVYKEMSYDPETDLVPIARVATAPLILTTGPRLKVKSYQDLMEVKDRDEPFTYGSAGNGGQQHLAGELLRIESGLNMLHVPYRGSALAATDVLAGQIDMGFFSASPILSNVREGKLNALFIAGPERQSVLPDVPTAEEVGLPNFHLLTWFGVFGPRGMTPQVAQDLAGQVQAALTQPEVVETLSAQGLTPSYLPPTEFRRYIASEMQKYGQIVEKANIEKQ
ncbi:tripartite tricarboxylate transporter substrate binding protein [Allopusillimonas soli]|uniref:Tripartite tricarboxylate transporter substrate binding protein n=1 Tax=Allopusillimonas soli TaxID=659016 RepID=A0A853FBN8_9BURK|nr:tripartite tricarboxylate transporter substrate binding protein [Allopusillimonas soli]NYT38185.1 tripartite tricarboxylate transporter substrate binding protein [Allopusillimonas soli]TEA74057.1 tripartite tricarboxylate transporter substrate binding protein [Allopusillimonas soli]